MYTEEDFKSFFLGPDGKVWKLTSFCEQPTATFARVDAPEITCGGAVGSPILNDFKKLIPEGSDHAA